MTFAARRAPALITRLVDGLTNVLPPKSSLRGNAIAHDFYVTKVIVLPLVTSGSRP